MKRFKDPIYGYIHISKEIVNEIIDTPEFQRLRYIKQTSYLPVYATALHNRFVHSLGVYFLGRKACEALYNNSEDIISEHEINMDISSIFQLACLLHDIGHAPFSHSGEDFYIDDKKTIYKRLKEEVDNTGFTLDVDYYHNIGKIAAPHEIMSVIVALIRFKQFFQNENERDFFARCITGYEYRNVEKNSKHAILNAFISLLNSTTIDVDRLDYLIRDAFVMGYNSISIDYDRLLDSVMLVKIQIANEHTPIKLAYRKSALSVIENVIYARDSEKKWVQNHPVILYEVFLIQQIITLVRHNYKGHLFSLESLLPPSLEDTNKHSIIKTTKDHLKELTKKIEDSKDNEFKQEVQNEITQIEDLVNSLNEHEELHLLCDDDIIHLAKMIDNSFTKELFDRNARRHPIWKSESEYKIFLDGFIGSDSYKELQAQLTTLTKFLNEEAPSHTINSETIDYCRKQLEYVPKSDFSDADKENLKHRYTLVMRWLNAFEEIYKEQKLRHFDFVIVRTSNFESSFAKDNLGRTPIFMPETGKTYTLNKLINLFTTEDIDRRKFFYVYYKKEFDETIDASKVGKKIAKLILD